MLFFFFFIIQAVKKAKLRKMALLTEFPFIAINTHGEFV